MTKRIVSCIVLASMLISLLAGVGTPAFAAPMSTSIVNLKVNNLEEPSSPTLASAALGASLEVFAQKTEYMENPIGIDKEKPLFSWKIDKDNARGVMQQSYQVLVASDATFATLVWDSGKIVSDQCNAIEYNGSKLAAGKQYFWKVTVSDNKGDTATSDVATFGMGMLGVEANWNDAQWITNLGGNAPPRTESITVEYIDHYSGGNNHWADSKWDTTVGGPTTVQGIQIPGSRVSTSGGQRFTGSMDPQYRTYNTNVPLMRKTFSIPTGKQIERATVYASALGHYELQINGEKVGEDYLAPGWTEYATRAQYQAYDVTSQISGGDNVLGAILAPGWYTGYISNLGSNRYGYREAMIANLVIEFADGTSQTIVTDDTWQYTLQGPIVRTDMFMGEIYNAQWELGGSKYGWTNPSYDPTGDGWGDVAIRFPTAYSAISEPGASYSASSVGGWNRPIALTAQIGQTIKKVKELAPVSITLGTTQNGQVPAYIIDMGQNFAGNLRLSLKGKTGETVRIRYGELLNTDVGFREFGAGARPKSQTGNGDGVPGSIYTESLRHARATDHYVFKSDNVETWEPNFTFHGFRYVEIVGDVEIEDIVGIVISNALPEVGAFGSSDPLLNQIYSNTWWSQVGNFISIPTDCPQRDERMGWGGDGVVFAETAMLNMDAMMMYQKWLNDIRDGQYDNGRFPEVAPNPHNMNGDIIWGAPAVIIPYKLYQMTGDPRPLQDGYEAMKRFMTYRATGASTSNHPNTSLSDLRLLQTCTYPDHLAPTYGTANSWVSGTCYYAYLLQTMIKTATVLGYDDDAQAYLDRFEAVRDAFISTYVNQSNGMIRLPNQSTSYVQSGYFMALSFGLTTPELEPLMVQRLIERIAQDGELMSAGFVSVNTVCPILQKYGYSELAYKFALSEEYPSWGYSALQGATTIWERWDAYMADQGFNQDSMNSYNHYSFGSVISWFYKGMAGINYDEASPGYKHITIQPVTDPRVDSVEASYDSIRGKIESGWKLNPNGVVEYNVVVPANITATFIIPESNSLVERNIPVMSDTVEGITILDNSHDPDNTYLLLGSGAYNFTAGLYTLADIRADEAAVAVNTPAAVTVSLSNAKGAGVVTLSFTADGRYLDLTSATALNGFTILDPLAWEYVGGQLWKGTVKLYCPGFVQNNDPLNVLSISGVVRDLLGDTTVTLTDFTVSGDMNGFSGAMPALIKTAEADISVVPKAPVYSKYDLNHDGRIDDLDLAIVVYYYLANDLEADWEEVKFDIASAKDCDVARNGRVDLADMIEVIANYCDSYDL
ncbi:MAG: family 78 glycoside hydrolase catalytic domain [Oscillospiraceae bacterium]|nr:family 78 glycoside hydrolase catalytic domain [Oscillospiraceae bacterium]